MAFGGIEAGRAFFRILLDTKEAKKEFNLFQRDLKKLSAGMRSFGRAMMGFGAALAAPFVIGVRQMTTYVDQMAKMSQRHDLTVKEMSGLANAAKMAGATFQDLEGVFESMNDKSVMLAEGTGEIADAFRTLGVDADAWINTDSVGRIAMLADALKDVEQNALRAGLAEQTMGASAQALLPLLNQGGGAVRDAAAGGFLDEETAKNAENLTDAITRLTGSLNQLVIALANSIAPILTIVIEKIAAWIKMIAEMIRQYPAIGQTLAGISAGFLSVGTAVSAAGTALSAFGMASTGMKALMGTTKFFASATMAKAIGALGSLAAGLGAVLAGVAAFAGGMAMSGKIAGFLAKVTGSTALAGTANTGFFQKAPELVNAVSQETIDGRMKARAAAKVRALGGAVGVGTYSTGQISGRHASAATLGAMGAQRDQTQNLLQQLVNNTGGMLEEQKNQRTFGTT